MAPSALAATPSEPSSLHILADFGSSGIRFAWRNDKLMKWNSFAEFLGANGRSDLPPTIIVGPNNDPAQWGFEADAQPASEDYTRVGDLKASFGLNEASKEAVRNYGYLVKNVWHYVVSNLLRASPTEQFKFLRIIVTYPIHWESHTLSSYRQFVKEGAKSALATDPGFEHIAIEVRVLSEIFATILSRCRTEHQDHKDLARAELVDNLCEPGEEMVVYDLGGASADVVVVRRSKQNNIGLLPFEPRVCAGFGDAGFNKLQNGWVAKIFEHHKNDIEVPDHISKERGDNWRRELITTYVGSKYLDWRAMLQEGKRITFLDKQVPLSRACLDGIRKEEHEFCKTSSNTIWSWTKQEAPACKGHLFTGGGSLHADFRKCMSTHVQDATKVSWPGSDRKVLQNVLEGACVFDELDCPHFWNMWPYMMGLAHDGVHKRGPKASIAWSHDRFEQIEESLGGTKFTISRGSKEGLVPWTFNATVFLTTYPTTEDLKCDRTAKRIPIWTTNDDITCSTLKDVIEKVTVLRRESIPLGIDSTSRKSTVYAFFMPQDDSIALCLVAAADGHAFELSDDEITLQLRNGKYKASVAIEAYLKMKNCEMITVYCPLNTMRDVKGSWEETQETQETEEVEEAETAGAEGERSKHRSAAVTKKRRGDAVNGLRSKRKKKKSSRRA